jgi:ABC-type glycerol-3-phosphate transport system substrate-binding protein
MVGSKFIPLIHNFGGRIIDDGRTTATGHLDAPDTIRAFQWLWDLCNVDKVCNLDFGHPDTAFQGGQAAMTIREPFYAAQVMTNNPDINFIVIPLPTEKTAVNTLGSGSWNFMINQKTQYADLCQLIISKFCTPEYDIRMHTPDKVPPILTANITMDNSFYKTLPYASAMIGSMQRPLGPVYDTFAAWTSVQTTVGECVAKIVQGQGTVQSDVAEAVSKINTILRQQ